MTTLKTLASFYLAFTLSLNCYAQEKRPTKLKFRYFTVRVVDFIVENPAYFQKLAAKRDTIVIVENPCNEDGAFIDNTIFRIAPRFKRDSFALWGAYQVFIYKLPEDTIKNPESWIYVPDYKNIQPKSKNQFIIPALGRNYIQSIKDKFSLRDTSVTGYTKTDQYRACFTRNGKIFDFRWDPMFIQISRFRKRKLKQIKYIEVRLLQKGCN